MVFCYNYFGATQAKAYYIYNLTILVGEVQGFLFELRKEDLEKNHSSRFQRYSFVDPQGRPKSIAFDQPML